MQGGERASGRAHTHARASVECCCWRRSSAAGSSAGAALLPTHRPRALVHVAALHLTKRHIVHGQRHPVTFPARLGAWCAKVEAARSTAVQTQRMYKEDNDCGRCCPADTKTKQITSLVGRYSRRHSFWIALSTFHTATQLPGLICPRKQHRTGPAATNAAQPRPAVTRPVRPPACPPASARAPRAPVECTSPRHRQAPP